MKVRFQLSGLLFTIAVLCMLLSYIVMARRLALHRGKCATVIEKTGGVVVLDSDVTPKSGLLRSARAVVLGGRYAGQSNTVIIGKSRESRIVQEIRAFLGDGGSVGNASETLLPLAISAFPELRQLRINGHDMDHSWNQCVSGMRAMERLELLSVRIDIAVLGTLASLPTLKEVVIAGAPLPQGSLGQLSECRTLESLSLGAVRFSGVWYPAASFDERELKFVCRMVSLRSLNLRGSDVSDGGIGQLVHAYNLISLDIGDTGITDDGFLMLTQMRALREIDVVPLIQTGQPRISDASIKRFESQRPDVKVVSLQLVF